MTLPDPIDIFLPGLGKVLIACLVGSAAVLIVWLRARRTGTAANAIGLFAASSISLWIGSLFFGMGVAQIARSAWMVGRTNEALAARWVELYHIAAGSAGFSISLLLIAAIIKPPIGFSAQRMAALNVLVWSLFGGLVAIGSWFVTESMLSRADQRTAYLAPAAAIVVVVVSAGLSLRRFRDNGQIQSGSFHWPLIVAAAFAGAVALIVHFLVLRNVHAYGFDLWIG